ncbi:myogenesis-regulating glycosidase-like [Glandiceps talaboti]
MFSVSCSKRTQQIFVGLLITLLIVGVLAWYYVSQHSHLIVLTLGPLELNGKLRQLSIDDDERGRLVIQIGKELTLTSIPIHCDGVGGRMNLCAEWIEDTDDANGMKLSRVRVDFNAIDADARCYNVHWQSVSPFFIPEDCIDFGEDHWYGGTPTYEQRLTLENNHACMQPYITGELWTKQKGYGSVMEKMWMSSKGMVITIMDDIPLQVSMNDDNTHLCIRADRNDDSYMYNNMPGGFPELKYTICDTTNIKQIYKYALSRYIELPKGQPDQGLINFPIWAVKPYFKDIVYNQTDVLNIAEQINDYGFNRSHIILNGKYSSHYGDWDFNPENFPDPRQMMDRLHDLGFRVTAVVSSIVNTDSKNYKYGLLKEKDYWMKYGDGEAPGLVKWWGGLGTVLDFTHERAVSWYRTKLKNLMQMYNIDALLFDGGEASHLPPNYVAHRKRSMENPNRYSEKFVDFASDFGLETQIGVGQRTQAVPLFVRMEEKRSGWGYNNGIKAIIPAALQYGLLGYPYFIPAPIGGNVDSDSSTEVNGLPDRELYIRWLELVTYLPVMEFTTLPWQYDTEVVQIAHNMVKIHETKVAPLVASLIREATQTGVPIIRPLWWISPEDPNALTEDTEFLIGEDLLVAPVLERGQRQRDIYLPEGAWKDELRGEEYEGSRLIRGFGVELDQIATFKKVTPLE